MLVVAAREGSQCWLVVLVSERYAVLVRVTSENFLPFLSPA